ncbi:MAG: hypothetical protein RBU30_19475, partial [Polyangia bacterium]|nr:hypothetical protein [Polyangia bacterium]
MGRGSVIALLLLVGGPAHPRGAGDPPGGESGARLPARPSDDATSLAGAKSGTPGASSLAPRGLEARKVPSAARGAAGREKADGARAARPPRTRAREPLSLESDPTPLFPMALGRAMYLWPSSPRLRTGVWLAVHYFHDLRRTFRQYDPEFVYRKSDSSLVAQVGAALRLGPVEISAAVPFVGLFTASFYDGEVIDRQARKVDRADLRLGLKYGIRVKRGQDLWLFTPYLVLTAPTGTRESYEVALSGHPVQHYTVPPRGVSVLPGFAVGWRRTM